MVKIIAELCQNHNGDFDILKKMIHAAVESGATHVKMQHIYSRNISFRPQFEKGLSDNNKTLCIKRPFNDEYQRLKSLEISISQSEEFVKICKANDIVPLTTCFTRDMVDTLYEIGFEVIKVASYDCASFQLIRELDNQFEELIISTGATFNNEIQYTAELLKKRNFSFLHCVTIYPTPLYDLNLLRMQWLRKFTNNVGFSDHSDVSATGLIASKAALAFGADIIERHFTILPRDQTKDGPVSIFPDELKILSDFAKLSKSEMKDSLVEEFPNLEKLLGSETRKLSHEELLNRDYYRGRFASFKNGIPVFNWEKVEI